MDAAQELLLALDACSAGTLPCLQRQPQPCPAVVSPVATCCFKPVIGRRAGPQPRRRPRSAVQPAPGTARIRRASGPCWPMWGPCPRLPCGARNSFPPPAAGFRLGKRTGVTRNPASGETRWLAQPPGGSGPANVPPAIFYAGCSGICSNHFCRGLVIGRPNWNAVIRARESAPLDLREKPPGGSAKLRPPWLAASASSKIEASRISAGSAGGGPLAFPGGLRWGPNPELAFFDGQTLAP